MEADPTEAYSGEGSDDVQMYNEFMFYNPYFNPIDDNDTVSSTTINETENCTGLPAFCPQKQLNVTQHLGDCGSKAWRGICLFAFIALCVIIILTNVMAIKILFSQSRKTSEYGSATSKASRRPVKRQLIIKASLAVADLLTGLNVLCSISGNYAETISMDQAALTTKLIDSTNSPTAMISGSGHVLTVEASILHLLLLSMERFSAIHSPLKHRGRRISTLCSSLVGVWFVAIFIAGIPGAFPKKFQYRYVPMLFLYTMNTNGDSTAAVLVHVFGLTLPYVATILFTIATGISGWRQLKKSEAFSVLAEDIRLELQLLKTVLVMLAAFTLTKVPIFVVFFMRLTGLLGCTAMSVSYTLTFFIATTNSLLNPIIYSIYYTGFRESFLLTSDRIKALICRERIATRPTTPETNRVEIDIASDATSQMLNNNE